MDEICFLLRSYKQSIAIDLLTIHERLDPDEWADSEGTIRLTRTGADIPAGQVICFQGLGYLLTLDMFTCGSNE